MTKVLVAVDFSESSRDAMRAAVRIANEADAELVVLHAWHVPAAFAGEAFSIVPELTEGMTEVAERGLAAALRDARAAGAKRVSGRAISGEPWIEIVEAATDPAIELVVVGTHGRTGLRRFLIGSVAEKVARHAACSVLVVRSESEPTGFTDVLCPVDFSECSQAAVEVARTLARSGGSGITLMHVVEAPITYAGGVFDTALLRNLEVAAARSLDQLAGRLRERVTVAVSTRTAIGHPGAEVLEVLDHDHAFDLVVLGSHGRTGITRVLVGSVAEKILRHAHCSVLVARSRAPS